MVRKNEGHLGRDSQDFKISMLVKLLFINVLLYLLIIMIILVFSSWFLFLP